MQARSVLKALQGEPATGVIPVELLKTNRIMERWAVSNGSGLPAHRWDDSRKAKPPPLDDHSAYIIDRIVRECPPRTNRIIEEWFRRPLPTSEIARQMGMTRKSLLKSVLVVLNFLKWKIENTKHPTLMRLLTMKID